MEAGFIACVAVGIGLIPILEVRKRKKLIAYYIARPTLYRAWIARYGREARKPIQKFIRFYCDFFDISPKIIHKIGPDDDLECSGFKIDGEDLDDFVIELKKKYRCQIEVDRWPITMGEMFEKVTNIKPKMAIATGRQ